MNDLTKAFPMPSELSERTMTLNLILGSKPGIVIRSCEILARGFRNRISFVGNQEINGILVGKLEQAVRESLEAVPDDGAHVLSLPDFLVELPGLALSGVHVMIMESRDGIRNAILRFKEFLGSMSNAFCMDIGVKDDYPKHADRLAASVLADICLPVLNLCREMEFALRDGLAEPSPDVLARAREFEFQTELLKRFIFNAGRGLAAPSQAHLADHMAHPIRLLNGQA
ncbi:hypothetical protein [uncultured Roseobacter sp.]|uniref:hypothetical protein n=1 Tax=uncultured Roseobacter sp. TaxID=114847 RepID=UPI0026325D61|nr:hypothetical protein [uncultured Roseobacter sp.]